MKVALVTTPPSVRSGIGDYTRHLLPYLREHCDVELFVDPTIEDLAWEGEEVRTVDQLRPREFDQILYQLGNERSHAFMARLVRAMGGTVVQHDWVLFDLAMAAFSALSRGGVKGHALALREGGIRQALVYSRNWLERRRHRKRPVLADDLTQHPGTLLGAWYQPEASGRWTSDRAAVRIPAGRVRRVLFDLHAEPPRRIRILEGGRVLAEGSGDTFTVEPEDPDHPVMIIETTEIRVSPEQRQHGDSRRLGSFVRQITWEGAAGEERIDLSLPADTGCASVTLSRDRFSLPLNRSVVRFADAFIVHSRYVRDLIVEDRNARTAIGIVHHGAEFRWREEARRETRRKLGLEGDWLDTFLVTSFGGVQPHKRVDRALEALARVRREGADVRLVLAGSLSGGEFDPIAMARRLGLEDVVRFTGFVAEEIGWDWLHAGDVALNLRGPSSGGTSGGIFQAFSLGRPVIATNAAEQAELPEACTIKVPLGDAEVDELARVLLEQHGDPAARKRLEAEARRFVETECHWGIVAKRYAEHLESFPPARGARRRLLARPRSRD